MNIYLIRHTTPAIAPGVCYGQTDVDVGVNFAMEAKKLQHKLPPLSSAHIVSSPSQRCIKLARAVVGDDAEVHEDVRLMELNFGEWELKLWDDIPRGLVDSWADDHVMQAPPGGESFHALSLRAREFLQQASNGRQHQNLVAFTHAGVIRALLAHALNLPLINAYRLQLDYASISHISMQPPLIAVGYVNR